MRKSSKISAILNDTLKFILFSRHFLNAIGIPDTFYGGKPPLLFRSMRIDFIRFRKEIKKLNMEGMKTYEFKQYKYKFKQLNTSGS